MEWFQNKSNVTGLLDFLIGAELIVDSDEVIFFYSHLERYTNVFIIYAREIMGIDTSCIKNDITLIRFE